MDEWVGSYCSTVTNDKYESQRKIKSPANGRLSRNKAPAKSCDKHVSACLNDAGVNGQKLTHFNDFWHVKSWENFDMKILQTCPPRLSDVATLPWEIQKSHFNSIIHIYFWLFTQSQKKKNSNILVHPTWKCHHTNLWIICCVLSNIGGSEKSQLWIVISGSEKNRLWCVATGMSGKQCHSKCSE